jgi:lysophospholipase L1-like esterase
MKTSFRFPLPLLLVFAAGMALPGGISAATDLPPLPPPPSATPPRKLSVPRRTNAPPAGAHCRPQRERHRKRQLDETHRRTPQPALELQDGDRVVLLGDTLIEREQRYGYVEARLTVRWPDRNITFRNLGWSADTVMGQSRVSFDWTKPEEEWFQQLTNQLAAVKPTVAILGYGMASSFAGEAGLPRFKADLNKLMDAIQSLSRDTKVRFMLLGPIRHEELGPPFPDPTEHNKQLERYSNAIQETARERGFPFIDLFHKLGDGTKDRIPRAYTDNGIHLNAYGYSRVGDVIERTMRWPANSWRVGILADGKIRTGTGGTEVTDLERTDDHVRLSMQDQRLVFPVSADGGKDQFPSTSPRNLLQFQGLKPGNYALIADGKELMIQTEKGWGSGRAILRGLSSTGRPVARDHHPEERTLLPPLAPGKSDVSLVSVNTSKDRTPGNPAV